MSLQAFAWFLCAVGTVLFVGRALAPAPGHHSAAAMNTKLCLDLIKC